MAAAAAAAPPVLLMRCRVSFKVAPRVTRTGMVAVVVVAVMVAVVAEAAVVVRVGPLQFPCGHRQHLGRHPNETALLSAAAV